MASSLERAFTRLELFHRPSALKRFLEDYLHPGDLLTLRMSSRTLSRNASLNSAAFRKIYIPTPPPPGREQLFDALEKVAEPCRDCVIRIAFTQDSVAARGMTPFEPLPPASPRSAEQTIPDRGSGRSCSPYAEPPIAWKSMAQRKPNRVNQELLGRWLHIFSLFPRMQTLTVACNGDPGWPGCTDIEALLIILRMCLERTNPESLHTVRFSPIHAMGVMHLRWHGAGVYGEPSAPRDIIWQRIKTLELQIVNPFVSGRLSDSQRHVFARVLQAYLRSFRRTLSRLNLSWVGAAGPDPFALEGQAEEKGLLANRLCLEELWLGNVAFDRNTMADFLRRASGLQKLRMWVCEEGDRGEDQAAAGTWVDHLASVRLR